ncbi:hypothetical protein ACLB6G_12440 [Zhengella sp. ZM62]|uniref:hypothetical protein n=1 Tax=Zhengella sedimenti TaxID=3390035 RepID=UPI0039761AEB
MKITLTCLPGYEDRLRRPCAATGSLPSWVRALPAKARSAVLDGGEVRTVKQCPPFLDAMRSGILFPLACDVRVRNGIFEWDWDLPLHPLARMTRSPLGFHAPEQAAGVPGVDPQSFAVKFNNFWTVGLPEGWSMLFIHPVNRLDLPYRTLSGLVDCDHWRDGFVHFPALWTEPDFEGVLPAGTPVAQGFPVRRETLELDFQTMDDAALSRHLEVQDSLQAEPGLYRKAYRAARG